MFCAMKNGKDSTADGLTVQDLLWEKDASTAALQRQVSLLSEQLAWLQRQLFVRRSDRLVGELERHTLPLDFCGPVVVPAPEPIQGIHYQRRKSVKNLWRRHPELSRRSAGQARGTRCGAGKEDLPGNG